MNKIFEFFSAAHRQFVDMHRGGYHALLTKRRAQTITIVVICTLITLVVFAMLSTIHTQKIRWSTSTPIVVAAIDLPAGTVLTDDNTDMVPVPLALVSADVLSSLPDNAVTRLPLRARTTLTSSLIETPDAITDVPEGWRIVALPPSLTAPPLRMGDAVDVVGGTAIIAQAVRVHSLEPLTVAVPADVAASVAAAARIGEISLVVSR